MHPMGTRILALAPRAQELAVAVEHHHRVLAAVEHVDVVPGVDADRADFLERPALGEPRPVLDDAVPVFAAPDNDRHALSPVSAQWIRSYFCKARRLAGCGWPGKRPGHNVQHTSPT